MLQEAKAEIFELFLFFNPVVLNQSFDVHRVGNKPWKTLKIMKLQPILEELCSEADFRASLFEENL